MVQAQGEGPVSLLVAEHARGRRLRGYARLAEGAAATIGQRAIALPPATLLGAGELVMTLDPGEDSRTLSRRRARSKARRWRRARRPIFRVSEQTDTAHPRSRSAKSSSGDAPPHLARRRRADAARRRRSSARRHRGRLAPRVDPVRDADRRRIDRSGAAGGPAALPPLPRRGRAHGRSRRSSTIAAPATKSGSPP